MLLLITHLKKHGGAIQTNEVLTRDYARAEPDFCLCGARWEELGARRATPISKNQSREYDGDGEAKAVKLRA